MNKAEIFCDACMGESVVLTEDSPLYCPLCGAELVDESELDMGEDE
jgi:Zn finger protein HypA/HybF involved in hydrogenase expression